MDFTDDIKVPSWVKSEIILDGPDLDGKSLKQILNRLRVKSDSPLLTWKVSAVPFQLIYVLSCCCLLSGLQTCLARFPYMSKQIYFNEFPNIGIFYLC